MNKAQQRIWEHRVFGLNESVAALIYVPGTHKNLLVDANTLALNNVHYSITE